MAAAVTTGSSSADRRARLGPALILLAALAVRLPHLGESIWLDEVYLTEGRIGPWSRLLATLYRDPHPPLYALFMHAWIGVFGDSEIAIRAPSLLFGLGSVALVHALARAVADGRTAMLAAAIVALAPAHVEFSREARPYAANLVFLLLAVLAWTGIARGDARLRTRLLLLVAATAACFTHYYSVPIVGVLFLVSVFGRARPRRGALALGLALAGIAGWVGLRVLSGRMETARDHLGALGPEGLLAFFLAWLPLGDEGVPGRALEAPGWRSLGLCALAAPVGAAFLLGLVRGLRPAPGRPPQLPVVSLCVLVLPAALLVLNALGLRQTYVPRAMLPVLPFWAVVAAVGARAMPRPATGLVIATLALALLHHHLEGHAWRNPDWRGAADHLIEAAPTDGRVLLIAAADWYQPLPYYRPEIDELGDGDEMAGRFASLRQALARRLGDGALDGALGRSLDALYDDLIAREKERREGVLVVVRLAEARAPAELLDWAEAEGIPTRRFHVLRWAWQTPARLPFLDALEGLEGVEREATARFDKLAIETWVRRDR